MAYSPVSHLPGMHAQFISDPMAETSSLILTWYRRIADETLAQAVGQALRDGVRKHLLEDSDFRAKVELAIKQAAVAMPLEEITKAVRQAIQDQRLADQTPARGWNDIDTARKGCADLTPPSNGQPGEPRIG